MPPPPRCPMRGTHVGYAYPIGKQESHVATQRKAIKEAPPDAAAALEIPSRLPLKLVEFTASTSAAAIVDRAESLRKESREALAFLLQKAAHRRACLGEMLRISGDWLGAAQQFGKASDLAATLPHSRLSYLGRQVRCLLDHRGADGVREEILDLVPDIARALDEVSREGSPDEWDALRHLLGDAYEAVRSEEHTSELQSLMRNSYAVFCLKKKKKNP